MNHDDLLEHIDRERWDVDGLIDDIDALPSSTDDVLEDILREFGSESESNPVPPKQQAPKQQVPKAQPSSVEAVFEDSGTYRSYDGAREYRSFDSTLPDAPQDGWYQEEEPEDAEELYYEETHRRERRRHPVLRGIGQGLFVFVTLLSICYLVVLYANVKPIRKLRNMYIGTAMTTINHKWLATAIVPSEIIDEVMRSHYETEDAMIGVESDPNWSTTVDPLPSFEATISSPQDNVKPSEAPAGTAVEQTEKIDPDEEAFFEIFWELDRDSVKKYMEAHPEELQYGWAYVDVNESSLDSDGTSMKTIYGDQVLAVNAIDGVMLTRIYLSPNRSRGVLAILKDTSRLSLCAATTLPSVGQTAGRICEDNNGILAMTGSAFLDPNGEGNGGELSGLAVSHGTILGERLGSGAKRLELRDDNCMYIVDSYASVDSRTRDACEFQPALIIDGTVYYDDYWSNPNPRAVLGQSAKLETMMVVLEGRLVSSLGCGVDYVSDKLKEYGCVQALNLDGGTSAIMYYKGEYITICSNQALPGGRTLPTAWVYKGAY